MKSGGRSVAAFPDNRILSVQRHIKFFADIVRNAWDGAAAESYDSYLKKPKYEYERTGKIFAFID